MAPDDVIADIALAGSLPMSSVRALIAGQADIRVCRGPSYTCDGFDPADYGPGEVPPLAVINELRDWFDRSR